MTFQVSDTQDPVKETSPESVAASASSPKLCLDAISEAWGYQNHKAPAEFQKRVADDLNMKDASHGDLNKAYMQKILDQELKKLGPTAGLKEYEAGKKGLGCAE